MGRGHSYRHQGGDTPLLGVTIPEHFRTIAATHRDREALVGRPQGRRFTYGSLAEEVDLVARGLLEAGFSRGDRIGIWSTNNVEWVIVQLATARIGVILVNINPAYRRQELAYALHRSQIQGLITIPRFKSSHYVDMLLALIPELEHPAAAGLHCQSFPDLHHVVVLDPGHPDATERPAPGFTTWSELRRAGQAARHDLESLTGALDIDDPINIQYTSGTTGAPKAVVLSHHNILNNGYFVARELGLASSDRVCVPVPFYHCFGMVVSNLAAFSVGATVVIPSESFDADAVLDTVATERCTVLHGVPTMFIALLEHPRRAGLDLTSLRTGIMAGAPCPPALLTRVMQDLHCPAIRVGYGQTEASPVTHLTGEADSVQHRTETVGRNLPFQEVKIVDPETGETEPCGEAGEVCFRGYHVMLGYYGDRDATKAAIDRRGWLHSGDLGVMDEDGYLRITGRLKEMIIRGGENVYPREIEDLLYTHPAIAEVAVFGIPDEYYGEEVVAWIKLHEEQQLSEEAVREFCRDRIAHFKIPRIIEFVTEFPMTVTGKVQKFRMREIAAAHRRQPAGVAS